MGVIVVLLFMLGGAENVTDPGNTSTVTPTVDCQEVNASEVQRQWCCKHQGVACTSQVNCTGDVSSLSESTRAWCCAREQVACAQSPPQNLTGDHDDCKASNLKDLIRQFADCCEHRGVACNVSSVCHGEMSAEEHAWCCEHGACVEYDCVTGASNWTQWTVERAVWCCKHHQVACEDPKVPFDCTGAEEWSSEKRNWCCEHSGLGCTTTGMQVVDHVADGVVDCHDASEHWPPGKREWCCRQEHVACLDEGQAQSSTEGPVFDCEADQGSWTRAQRDWCCINKELGCTPLVAVSTAPSTTLTALPETTFEPFNCQADPLEDWSERKRAWCCNHKQVACLTSTSEKPTDIEATYTTCEEDQIWTPEKRMWCCKNMGQGCLAVRTSSPFDCFEGSPNGWSPTKTQWCCFNLKVGCPEFDCEDGFSNWRIGFSSMKKRWCCEHYGMACEESEHQEKVEDFRCEGDPEYWPREQQQWCCLVEKRGCLSDLEKELLEPAYDCSDESRTWSEEQATWCCFEKGVGCEFEPYSYSGYTATGWPEAKQETDDSSFYFMLGLCATLLAITYLRNKGSMCGDNGRRSYHYGPSPSTTYGRGSYSALGSRYSPPALPT